VLRRVRSETFSLGVFRYILSYLGMPRRVQPGPHVWSGDMPREHDLGCACGLGLCKLVRPGLRAHDLGYTPDLGYIAAWGPVWVRGLGYTYSLGMCKPV
jgi:hypothetical protein